MLYRIVNSVQNMYFTHHFNGSNSGYIELNTLKLRLFAYFKTAVQLTTNCPPPAAILAMQIL
jgi:hypothetical protein